MRCAVRSRSTRLSKKNWVIIGGVGADALRVASADVMHLTPGPASQFRLYHRWRLAVVHRTQREVGARRGGLLPKCRMVSGQTFPRVGFIATNLSRPAERLFAQQSSRCPKSPCRVICPGDSGDDRWASRLSTSRCSMAGARPTTDEIGTPTTNA